MTAKSPLNSNEWSAEGYRSVYNPCVKHGGGNIQVFKRFLKPLHQLFRDLGQPRSADDIMDITQLWAYLNPTEQLGSRLKTEKASHS